MVSSWGKEYFLTNLENIGTRIWGYWKGGELIRPYY